MTSALSKTIKISVSALLLFLLSYVSAQQLKEEVEVRLVQVDLTATDSDGAPVTNLTAGDFILKENGKPQAITHFYNAATEESRFPLTMSFVVDTSYSMHEKVAGLTRIDIALKAAELVLSELKPKDQIEVIEFNNEPEVVVPFTSDIASVHEQFKTLNFREANTAMHDAVVFAVNRIKDRTGRKIIVVFSDGMDSASKSVEEDVVEAIRKSDATIVAFYSEFARLNFPGTGGMGHNPNTINRVRIQAGEDLLRDYAEMSGGQFFSFRKEPELVRALEKFRSLVESQYTLAYTPAANNKKAGWRKFKVECKRKGIKLRHRQGYYAG